MSERVALLPTCLVETMAPHVGEAVIRVLRRLNVEIVIPSRATCCGQPAWNAGFAEQAGRVARTTLEALHSEKAQCICVPAGSCATMMRLYWPELFRLLGDERSAERAQQLAPRIKEFSEFVAERTGGQIEGRYRARIAYHHSCHLLRELGVAEAPVALLSSIQECDLVPWPLDEQCCGFGGLFSVKQPETSVALADEKLDSLTGTDAEELVGCDQSCLLHLEGRMRRRGESLRVRHLAEVLDGCGKAL